MRTFSKLRALCSHPEQIERPNARRDAAAALGTDFHKWVEKWRRCAQVGEPVGLEGLEGHVYDWARRMLNTWEVPDDLEVEVAMGLAEAPRPFYVPVVEKPEGSHVYVSVDGTKLLTAGRADLLWPDPVAKRWHVADIKTGQTYLGDPGLLRQVLAQGFAAVERADGESDDGFVPGIYYARLGMWDWGRPVMRGTPEWDRAWSDVYRAATMTSDPQPGPHCLGCWDKKACAANPEAQP